MWLEFLEDRDAPGEGHVTTEAETGVKEAKGHKVVGHCQKLEELNPESQREPSPADTLVPDFWPQALGETNFRCFKPSMCGFSL